MSGSNENEFAKIPVCAAPCMVGDDRADYSLYLSGDDRAEPVLYRKAGSEVTLADVEKLSEDGIGSVYVRFEDLGRCDRILEDKLAETIRRADISAEDKSELLRHVGAAVARALTQASAVPDELARADNVVQCVIAALQADSDVAMSLLRVSAHDGDAASHMFAVSAFALILGARFGITDPERLRELGLAGMTHDLGKLGMGGAILNKRGPLHGEEARLIQQHPIESVRLLGDHPTVTPLVRQVILQHHERLDGRGYPIGLMGSDLLIESRILSVVDCFHALIGNQGGHDLLKPSDANKILLHQSGRQFDPDILRAWVDLFDDDKSGGVAERSVEPSPSRKGDREHAHSDHNTMRPVDRAIEHRPHRKPCQPRTVVAYMYVGRLGHWKPDRSTSHATMDNLSRTGVGLKIDHPVYRGEILNIQLTGGPQADVWVRATVAWCRRIETGGFLVGLRFLKRISVSAARAVKQPLSSLDLAEPVVVSDSVSNDSESNAEAIMTNETPPESGNAEHLLAALERAKSGKDITPQDAKAIIELSQMSDPELRCASVDAIARIHTAPARSALLALLRDPIASVRERSAAVVVAYGMEDMYQALRPLLKDTSPTIALTAAAALATGGDKSAVGVLVRAVNEEGPQARKAAALLGRVFGQRFPANSEGVKSARRYIKGRKLSTVG